MKNCQARDNDLIGQALGFYVSTIQGFCRENQLRAADRYEVLSSIKSELPNSYHQSFFQKF